MKKLSLALLLLVLSACSDRPAASPAAATPVPAPKPQVQLSVSKGGSGIVQSIPAGIYCDGVCTFSFEQGTRLSLRQSAAQGWEFSGWGGACADSGTQCELHLLQDSSASALFSQIVATPPPVTPPPKTCAAYRGPALDSLNHYEGLMHEHSSYSDGHPDYIPADYFRIAQEAGYSFVGASEHSDTYDSGVYFTASENCITSPDGFQSCFLNPDADKLQKWDATQRQAEAASASGQLRAIRGFEWTSDVFGHINVYFSKNFTNAKTDGGYAASMETFWAWFTRDADLSGEGGSATSTVPNGGGMDGLAHFNHPHDKCQTENDPSGNTAGFCDWNDYTLIPAAVERMFGMEVYNDGNRNDRYQAYYTRALDKGWRLAPVGSEDEHFAEYAVEHRPKTVTLATGLDEAAFKDAWLARRTYALTPGQHLRVSLTADGHPMGAQLQCDIGKPVDLRVDVRHKDGSLFQGSLQLYSNGGKQIAALDAAQGSFQIPVQAGRHWHFVRVHAPDGTSVAYLAPIWIESR